MTRQDVTRIAEHLDISEAGVRMRFVAPSGDRLRDGQGAACVFLESDRGLACCAIYPVRPEKCQSWPYWEALSESEEALQEAMAYCPGITRRSLK